MRTTGDEGEKHVELTHQNEATVVESSPRAAGLTVGMSAALMADAVFAGAVRSAVAHVCAAFDPGCHATLLDPVEVTEVRTGGIVLAAAKHPTAAVARRVIGLGASGVIDRRGDPHAIVPALTAAVTGLTVLPPALGPVLLTRLDDPPAAVELDAADLELLQDVASGMTLDDVALVRDRSTRTIRRDLRDLWARMGVTGRAQGLVLAARWGLVD